MDIIIPPLSRRIVNSSPLPFNAISTDVDQAMIEQIPGSNGPLLGFQLSGRLYDLDYQKLVPVIESAIAEYGKVRHLSLFHDFMSWDPQALWDDI